MSERIAISGLVVRTLGWALVMYTLATFPDRLIFYFGAADGWAGVSVAGVLFSTLLPVVVGLLLLLFPERVARHLGGSGVQVPGDLQTGLAPIVFGGIGLYVALNAVLDLTYYWLLSRSSPEGPGFEFLSDAGTRAEVATTVLALFLGLGLLVGARGLSGLLAKLRGGL